MHDENTFTQRARDWVKDKQPNVQELQSAYRKMQAKIDADPSVEEDDAESCLEFLAATYEHGGGDMDAFLAGEKNETNKNARIPELDSSTLGCEQADDIPCSGQLIPDTELRFFSAMAGGSPPLNWCGRIQL